MATNSALHAHRSQPGAPKWHGDFSHVYPTWPHRHSIESSIALCRAVLLGKDPYSADEPLQERPGRVNGTILNNVVVGTVRLRQQRVRLDCTRTNQLLLPNNAMLCYKPDIWGGRSTDDWAWPAFLATSNGNRTAEGPHHRLLPCRKGSILVLRLMVI